jgi:hypothetical protein
MHINQSINQEDDMPMMPMTHIHSFIHSFINAVMTFFGNHVGSIRTD